MGHKVNGHLDFDGFCGLKVIGPHRVPLLGKVLVFNVGPELRIPGGVMAIVPRGRQTLDRVIASNEWPGRFA